jgi:hypothetical protein
MASKGEKRLWNAVLLLAAQDARSAKAPLRAETAAWLSTKDFETVCEWAGQSPETIKQAIEKILVQKTGHAIHGIQGFGRNNTLATRMPLERETEGVS